MFEVWDVCEDDHENYLLKELMCQLADRKNDIMETFLYKDSVQVVHFTAVMLQENSSR